MNGTLLGHWKTCAPGYIKSMKARSLIATAKLRYIKANTSRRMPTSLGISTNPTPKVPYSIAISHRLQSTKATGLRTLEGQQRGDKQQRQDTEKEKEGNCLLPPPLTTPYWTSVPETDKNIFQEAFIVCYLMKPHSRLSKGLWKASSPLQDLQKAFKRPLKGV